MQNSLAKMLPTLICLAVSTVLNAIYFMKTVIYLYTPASRKAKKTQAGEAVVIGLKEHPLYNLTLVCMIVLNVILGCCSQPIVDWITEGLAMFG